MSIIFAGATDIGRKRKTNQDSICLVSDQKLFVVADGMGGHSGGDIASQMSVKLMPEFTNNHPDLDVPERLKQAVSMLTNPFLITLKKIVNSKEWVLQLPVLCSIKIILILQMLEILELI